LDGLDCEKAIWVGHDWGCATVWSIASHHPDRCFGVANLCVPYRTLELGIDVLISLVNRSVYPLDEFPAGQWEYQMFYRENFARAQEVFDNNPYNAVRALFRKWGPNEAGLPALTAHVRRDNGWFGGMTAAPDTERDDDVVSEADLRIYASALERNSFFGPCSYYMNHERNAEYAKSAQSDGVLEMPVLFLNGIYDHVCQCSVGDLGKPMRESCHNLTEYDIRCGHWMAQEKPREVNSALANWIAKDIGSAWPLPPFS
ncbi:MAG: alpha/beta hydrolase, partial [Pseudomonadota bacterium]